MSYISFEVGMKSVPRWINSLARPLNRSSVIDDRVHNFRRRRTEKERSQLTLPLARLERWTAPCERREILADCNQALLPLVLTLAPSPVSSTTLPALRQNQTSPRNLDACWSSFWSSRYACQLTWANRFWVVIRATCWIENFVSSSPTTWSINE